MSYNENIQEQIEQYLNGTLQENDLALFEADLSADPNLRAQVEATRLANEIVFDAGLLDVKKRLQHIRTQQGPVDHGVTSKGNYFKAAAAVIVSAGLLVGGYLYYSSSTETSVEVRSEKKTVQDLNPDEANQTQNPKITTPNNNPVTSKGTDQKSTFVDKKVESIDKSDHDESNLGTADQYDFKIIPEEKKERDTLPSSDGISQIENEEETITGSDVTDSPRSDIDPCESVVIEFRKGFELYGEPTCEGTSNGVIVFPLEEDIIGGEGTYSILINDREFDLDQSEAGGLSAASYTVNIVDANGCQSDVLFVDVESYVCDEEGESKHLCQGANAPWVIPNQQFETYTLVILSQSDGIVLRKTINQSSDNNFWDGTNNYGAVLADGLYHFKIMKDGQVIDQGDVSLIKER